MNIASWVVFGIVIGSVSYFMMPRRSRGGFVSTLMLGALGAVLGGFLGDLLFSVPGTIFSWSSLVISGVGALVILVLNRAFIRNI